MKKKLMMVAVLFGALSLGACVDDNESQSVTDVREAKAEQLRSVAEMYKAEAQAKATLAAAEAALMQAQAEAQKAKAALDQAEAEITKKQLELLELQKEQQSIENQKRKAELERELSNLEVTKKQNEQTLARIAAQMEQAEMDAKAALLRAQLSLKEAEQDLLDYDKRLAEAATQAEKEKIQAERRELQNLTYAYQDAVYDLLDAKNTLSFYKRNLIAMENDLVSWEESKKKSIAENNNRISLNEMRIAQYKKYTNYTEDITSLENKINELSAENSRLWDEYRVAESAFNDVNVNTEASSKATEAISNDKFFLFAVNRQSYDAENDCWWRLDYVIEQYLPYSYGVYSQVKISEYQKGDYTFSEWLGVDSIYVDFASADQFADLRVVENAVNERLKEIKGSKVYPTEELEKAQAAYNGKATLGSFGYCDAQGKPLATPCRNAVDSTAYLKKAYEEATVEAKKEELYQLYKEALDREIRLAENIEYYQWWIEDFEGQEKRLKEEWDMYQKFDAYKAELQAKMDKRNELNLSEHKDKVAAWNNKWEKYVACEANNAEWNAVYAIYQGNNGGAGAWDISEWIKTLEEENERLKKDNEDISGIESQQEMIADQKMRIEAQEVVVKTKEIALNNAKADLDAAMAKQEETPAE